MAERDLDLDLDLRESEQCHVGTRAQLKRKAAALTLEEANPEMKAPAEGNRKDRKKKHLERKTLPMADEDNKEEKSVEAQEAEVPPPREYSTILKEKGVGLKIDLAAIQSSGMEEPEPSARYNCILANLTSRVVRSHRSITSDLNPSFPHEVAPSANSL